MWTSSTQMKYIKYELDNFDIWSASKYQSKAINAGLQHRSSKSFRGRWFHSLSSWISYLMAGYT
mgnify:CR=1 FL=1